MLGGFALLLLWASPSTLKAGLLFSTLISFEGTNGLTPSGALTQGPDGAFYGTTTLAGTTHDGTVFRVEPDGTFDWEVFLQGTNGTWPVTSKLLLATDGNLYGTTYKGGANDLGTIFRVSTNGVLTTLVSFTGTNGSYLGSIPQAGLIEGTHGNFYGTTSSGGASDAGTIFEVTSNGDFTSLASFHGSNGASPQAPLLLGPDENLYGTTEQGGTNGNWGTVFRVKAGGGVTSLFSFGGTNVTVRRSRLTLRGKGVAGWRCETTLLSIPHAQTPPHHQRES